MKISSRLSIILKMSLSAPPLFPVSYTEHCLSFLTRVAGGSSFRARLRVLNSFRYEKEDRGGIEFSAIIRQYPPVVSY